MGDRHEHERNLLAHPWAPNRRRFCAYADNRSMWEIRLDARRDNAVAGASAAAEVA